MDLLPTLENFVGGTPLVRLQRLPGSSTSNTVLVKLEGNNPAGSVKDRAALSMIQGAETRGEIVNGDHLVEATSGNTGIALAMVAAMKNYKLTLVMPEHMSIERRALMKAFGAKVHLVSKAGGMEEAIDTARSIHSAGKAKILDQFANKDNPNAHYEGTGPEIWKDTGGKITHFVSAMGTTGTIMGVSRFLKEQDPAIQIIGVQPKDGAAIPGIRRWPESHLPKIYEPARVDRIIDVSQEQAETMTRQMAAVEGIFSGISSGGALAAALQLSQELEDAVIVVITCDRGDRYLSTDVFPS